MASPMIDFCEQAKPKVLNEVQRARFQQANRIQQSLLACAEKRTLIWLAERTPTGINSDHLTVLGSTPNHGRSQLRSRQPKPKLAASGDRIPCPQLARRQPERHPRPSPPATAPPLRLLR